MTDARATLGMNGERAAERYLRKHGLRIVARRWRHGRGEIDLIAEDGDEVVFIEVKTRSSAGFGAPLDAIDAKKQETLRRLALAFMGSRSPDAPYRIDVIGVLVSDGGVAIEHLRSAVPGGD